MDIIDFIEEKLEEEYGYLPGVYEESTFDMYTKTKEELKEIIKKEFPKFVQGDQLVESATIQSILDELENI